MIRASDSKNALPRDYQLGEYKIQSVLGHGGFGITYLAMDTKLSSLVAIKEYFPRSFASRDQQSTITPSGFESADSYRWGLEEFLKEARVLAKFKHNYIVRVQRYLETNGTAYMVMEYEQGESLESYLRKRGGFLDEKTLFAVFLPILSGLQAVHDAGLLHLDIKPDNIYLRADGQPMLIDFGSASRITRGKEQRKAVALTPAYSAIENYPDKGEQGPWSDLYSIGATLYRCITGKQPMNTIDRFETINQGKPDPFIPATKLERPIYTSYIRESIDWAMQLAPEDRPRRAAALQNALMGKGLTNEEPKEYQANILRSGFIGVVGVDDMLTETKRSVWSKLLLTLLFMSVMFIFMLKTGMISEAQVYRIAGVIVDSTQSIVGPIEDKVAKTFRLRRHRTEPQQPHTTPAPEQLKVVAPALSAGFNPAMEVKHNLTGHVDQVQSMAFMNQGSILATASADGIIKLWKTSTGELVKTLHSQQNRAGIIASSRNGNLLATISRENTISIWSATTNAEIAKLVGHGDSINQIAFSIDSTMLASVSDDKTVILWNIAQKSIAYQFKYEQKVLTVAFSPNGRWIATGDVYGEIVYRDVASGRELARFKAYEKEISLVLYSPQGKWLASSGADNFLKLWNVAVTESDRPLTGAPTKIYSMVFSPDNNWLIVAGSSNEIKMWNINSGELVHRLYADTSEIGALAISSNGRLVASAEGTKVKIWNAQ